MDRDDAPRILIVGNHPDLVERAAPHLDAAGFIVHRVDRWFGRPPSVDRTDLLLGHAGGPVDRYGLVKLLGSLTPTPTGISVADGPTTVPGCAFSLRYPLDLDALDRVLASALPDRPKSRPDAASPSDGPALPPPPVMTGPPPPRVSLAPAPIAPANSRPTVPLSATDIEVVPHLFGGVSDDDDDAPVTLPDSPGPAQERAADGTPDLGHRDPVDGDAQAMPRDEPPVAIASSAADPEAPASDPAATTTEDSLPADAEPTSERRVWMKLRDVVDDQGELGGHRLADLLHHCAIRLKTGVIALEREGHHKRIYLQAGVPVYARSWLREETLGAYLLKKQLISEEDHRVALAKMSGSGKRLGEVLVDMEVFRARDAYRHLNDHIRSKLIAAFGWNEGTYRFRELPRLPAEITGVPMHAPGVIIQGLQAHFDLTQLPRDFVPFEAASGFRLEEPAYTDEQLMLSPGAARIRHELETGASIASLIHAIDASLDEITGIVYALYVLQVIGLTETVAGETDRRSLPEPDSRTSIDLADDHVEVLNETCDAFLDDYLRLRPLDCFGILGLDPDAADDEAVRRAFESLHERLHPERFDPDEVEPVLDKIHELWAQIYLAHRTLATAEGRARYRRGRQDEAEADPHSSGVRPQTNALAGEVHFQAGRTALAARELDTAIEAFDAALGVDPIEPAYLAHRAWAMYCKDPQGNRQHAIAELNTARSLDSSYAGVSYFLGRICLDDDANEIAVGYLEMALRADPDYREAEQYLQIARSRLFAARRASAPAEPEGALSRLFRRRR